MSKTKATDISRLTRAGWLLVLLAVVVMLAFIFANVFLGDKITILWPRLAIFPGIAVFVVGWFVMWWRGIKVWKD
jgi:hypothetical protein